MAMSTSAIKTKADSQLHKYVDILNIIDTKNNGGGTVGGLASQAK